ncbi:galactosyldiacylglycerol synthase [Meiothermus taiwanensis]|nr:galactosyldiacylglycerol synthase [Meiothermus taiwanensis]
MPTSITGMVQLFNADTGAPIGQIGEAQLEFLVAQMEEEHAWDQDYYLNADLLEAWREQGADPALIELLAKAMGDKEDLNIRWSR